MPRDPKDTSVTSEERIQRRLAEAKDTAEPAFRRAGSGASGAEGKEGKAGATWYSGTTVPSTGLGVTGDFYFRTTTSDVYKKTAETTWSFQVNIKGEQGEKGEKGATGEKGVAGRDGQIGRSRWRPTGTKAENLARIQGELKNSGILTSGTLILAGGLELISGEKYKELHFYSATTAAVEPKNQWVVLCDINRKVLARSADKTTEAWGANTKKSFTFESEYTAPEDEAVYAGLLVVATTVPTLQAKESVNSFPLNLAPILGGNSTTGLTVPAGLAIGATAAALTGTTRVAYATIN